jgi:hypothetical protein
VDNWEFAHSKMCRACHCLEYWNHPNFFPTQLHFYLKYMTDT